MIQPQTLLALLNLTKTTKYEMDFMLADKGYTIAENRNYLAIQAIKGKYSHLFTVDDDMILPDDTINRLVACDKDFVGVLANSRTLPQVPMVTPFGMMELSLKDRMLGDIPLPKELFECEAIGGSVQLIKTSVFQKLEMPWYDNEKELSGKNKMGEDYWFCRQCIKAGVQIWCDPTLKIGHVGTFIY